MRHTYQVEQQEDGMILRDFLRNHDVSTTALKLLKLKGDILVNDTHQTVRYLLHVNDTVTLCFPKEESNIIPSDIPIDICYEDEHFLIINKPSSMPVIPTRRYPIDTLSNAIVSYYQKNNIEATVHLINRLDKDTRGLLLVAKDRFSHHLVTKQMQHIKRIYHCLVEGKLEGSGTIDLAIKKSSDGVKRYIDKTGKPSITHYRSLFYQNNMTLVECVLETGRTHQIRVHMEAIGHPLVGDQLYGSMHDVPYYLESVYLSFYHPYLHQTITIQTKNYTKIKMPT